MDLELKGKVAIVTGAASGIGRAAALAYAREGAHVIVSDIDEEGGQETVRQIEGAGGGQVAFVRADASKADDNGRLVDEARERFGGLHFACNNAGIGGDQAPVADMSAENWERVIAINLSSIFYGMKAQIPAMLQSGGGSVVNIASILGQVAFPQSPAYVAAKHGVVGLTRSAALDYSAQGVRVNAVGPGFVDTAILSGLDGATRDMLTGLHPIGRIGRAEEIADLIVYLSSERASFVSGAYYAIDGGYLAR